MADIVSPADFTTGDILISQSEKKEIDLEVIIPIVEKDVLQKMFGKELYDLFIVDFDAPTAGEPTDQRFKDVFNEFYIDEDFQPPLISEGIKRMLMRFIWADYVRDQPFQNTTVGMVRNQEENSSIATGSQFGWSTKYNKAVHSYCAIQIFMIDDSDTYPEFKGIPKQLSGII